MLLIIPHIREVKRMKVKALMDCVGMGYEFKTGDVKELKPVLAEKLIKFGYVVEVKSFLNVNSNKPKEAK